MSLTHQLAMNRSQEVHSFVVEFETLIPFSSYREYAMNRPFLPVVGITLYLLSLITGRRMMENRKPLHLKPLLFVWNTALALFSILSTIRFAEIILHQYTTSNDTYSFFCKGAEDNVTGFWYMLFVYSKFAEFGDTIFLILRKRNIMFLHWYHHVTVLLMAWIVFVENSAVGPFFGGVNVFIHSLMYTYYALQTVNIRLPKIISMILTMMQTTQMLIGLVVVYMTHAFGSRGCNSSKVVTICASIMYGSYFLLFARFFVQSYLLKPCSRPAATCSKNKGDSLVTSDMNNNNNNNVCKKIE